LGPATLVCDVRFPAPTDSNEYLNVGQRENVLS